MSKQNNDTDVALFVGYYFWAGYNKSSFFTEFDEIYKLAQKFVQTYSPDKNWENECFEEYMHNFIINNIKT